MPNTIIRSRVQRGAIAKVVGILSTWVVLHAGAAAAQTGANPFGAGATGASAVSSLTPAQRKLVVKQAKKDLAAGQKLLKEGTFDAALLKLDASYAIDPTPAALRGVADAQAALRRVLEACRSYEKLLETHGGELKPADRAAAEQALEGLRAETGTLRLSASESDAKVTLDGLDVPPEQILRPIRLLPGNHEIAAKKLDFEPYATTVEVVAGKEAGLDVRLQPEKKTGFVRVTAEKAPSTAELFVDGAKVGPAPWQGDLAPGTHSFELAGPGLVPAKKTVDVTAKAQLAVDLEVHAAPLPPPKAPAPAAAPAAAHAAAPMTVASAGATASPDLSAGSGSGGTFAEPPATVTSVAPVEREREPGVRVGLLLGLVALPRPLEAELTVKLGRWFGVGAQYSMLPKLSVPGNDSSLVLNAIQGVARVFPFHGSFYVGTGFGYQTFKATLATGEPGQEVAVSADMSTFFVSPQLGWLWIWRSGFALGINIGAQIPLSKEPTVTASYGGQPVPDEPTAGIPDDVTTSANNAKEEVRTLARYVVKYPIPNIDLLKIGFFF